MAYFVERPSGRIQIRESLRDERGPRSRTLVSFHGPLCDEHLDRAEQAALRPFDRRSLIARARARGIGWRRETNGAARELIGGLRRGATLDPALTSLLMSELRGVQATAPIDPDDFEEATEWLGSDAHRRAETLQGLIRLGDAIARSRPAPSAPARTVEYPRIDSTPRAG